MRAAEFEPVAPAVALVTAIAPVAAIAPLTPDSHPAAPNPPSPSPLADVLLPAEVKFEPVVESQAGTTVAASVVPVEAPPAANDHVPIVDPPPAPPEPPPPVVERHLLDIAPELAVEPPEPPPFVPQAREDVPASLAADAARTLAVYQLALAVAAAAVFSVVPAVWDVVDFLRTVETTFVARWALALFFLGVVQLAYAVYLFQLPDWTTVWVVTLFSLVLAAVYAAVLGLVLLSPLDGLLVGDQGLQLADKLAGGKAALWCLCMISLSTVLAFFAGRLGASWHRAEMMLRAAAA